MNGFKFLSARTAALAMAAFLASCASTGPDDPSGALDSPGARKSEQLAAVRSIAHELEAGSIEREEGRESLKRIAWRRGAPNDVRLAAIDGLLKNDPHDTSRMLSLMLPTETDWEVIARICDLASEEGWVELAPALVRSWSRPVVEPPDDERPERKALQSLFPNEPVESVVYRVFSEPVEGRLFGDRARTEAWALLQRIDRDGSLTQSFLAADSSVETDDPLLSDLYAGARELGVSPRTAEQLEWLRAMRAPEHREFWRRAADAVRSLNESQREGFALRHVAAVHWASLHAPQWLNASRAELLDVLTSELSSVNRHQRTDGYVDFTGDQRETLTAWGGRLSWGDLLLALIANRALAHEGVTGDLFEQADRDQADRTTEHGGVLDAAGNGFVAVAYPPRPTQRLGDSRFVASNELLAASVASLFHYHFHAQRYRNEAFAGPGHGDLEYADRFGRACIVLTFITKDVLNADFYVPGGARLDLGEARRPAGE